MRSDRECTVGGSMPKQHGANPLNSSIHIGTYGVSMGQQ